AKNQIKRPGGPNAVRPPPLAELRDAFTRARDDTEVAAVIFTGAGERAFCSGGDQRIRGDDGYLGGGEGAQRGSRPPRGRRPARPDPQAAEAGGGDGGGLRGRRRPHPPPGL